MVLQEIGPPPVVHKSLMSITLMQNYILAICLMKNVVLKQLYTDNPTPLNEACYKHSIKTQIEMLSEAEAIMILRKHQALGHNAMSMPQSKVIPIEQGLIPIADEISVSYLIVHHKKEILDANLSYHTMID